MHCNIKFPIILFLNIWLIIAEEKSKKNFNSRTRAWPLLENNIHDIQSRTCVWYFTRPNSVIVTLNNLHSLIFFSFTFILSSQSVYFSHPKDSVEKGLWKEVVLYKESFKNKSIASRIQVCLVIVIKFQYTFPTVND